MKLKVFLFLVFLVGFAAAGTPQVEVEVGDRAPDFELLDASGKAHKLSDYRGEKIVVLEFFRSGDW